MTYRILILADHAWRDIPGHSAVAVALESVLPDSDVRVVDIHLFAQAVELFKPHVLVINHLHDPERNKIVDTVRRRGGLCVVLPTEGRPSSAIALTWATTMFDIRLCDLYLAWSDTFSSLMPESINRAVVGCPRFDFYFHPLSQLVKSRSMVRSMLQLDENRPVVTVASSFPTAKFKRSGAEFAIADWKKLGLPESVYNETLITLESKAFDDFQAWILHLAREMPEAQIVVKPHPAENINDWRGFCDGIGAHLMLTDYIWSLLAISDVHVARLDCTTLPEAWILGRPTVACQVGPRAYDGPGMDARGLSDETAVTADGLVVAVDETLPYRAGVSGAIGLQHAYLEKWLGQMPGSVGRAANAIANLVLEKQPKTHDEPTSQQLADFHKLLVDHSNQHATPKADSIGQYAKNPRLEVIQEWRGRIRDVLSLQ